MLKVKPYLKRFLQFLLPITALFLFILLLVNYWVLSFSKENMVTQVKFLPETKVGLVFGASVRKNLEPSDILKDRLKVAADAYILGKIKKIIVSGDNSKSYYNEPIAMEQYLIALGIEQSDIYLDYAGFDTFDSLYRAKHVFGVNEITLFTQDFHLKRALYISKRLGLKTYGVETNLHNYLHEGYNARREVLARVKAFLDIEINNSKPKFLGPLIDMTKPQIKE